MAVGRYNQRLIPGFDMTFNTKSSVLLLVVGCIIGCSPSEDDDKGEVEVERQSPSVGVNLSKEAREAVGLVTQEVRRRFIEQTIPATGWLTVKPGQNIVVKASAAGFILPTSEGVFPQLGDEVSNRQTLGSLQIFLAPNEEAQLVALKEDADILIRQSLTSLRTAEKRLDQVKNLQGGALAGKEIQAIQQSVETSRAAYEEAREKLPFLPPEPYQRPLQISTVQIEAPISGQITEFHVRPRQLVIQGDPLWTISDWSSLWIKVPVFEGDLPRIKQGMEVEVIVPGVRAPITARPTGIPQPTREGRRTVDVLYEVDNSSGNLRPGQAVSVSLPTGESQQKLVVPKSAIVWDGMGNAWVYVERPKDRFERQRVELGQTIDDGVVVEHGLVEKSVIVTVATQSLYGEEFKGQIQLEDDD